MAETCVEAGPTSVLRPVTQWDPVEKRRRRGRRPKRKLLIQKVENLKVLKSCEKLEEEENRKKITIKAKTHPQL